MKYIKETKVLYADTDSYKVVWHGSYLRWMEEGRYSLCNQLGVGVDELDKKGITFPIVDMHVRYKTPAMIFDDIIIETSISELKTRSITFAHTIKNKKSGATLVTAEIVCVAVCISEAKLQKLPNEILIAFKNAIE